MESTRLGADFVAGLDKRLGFLQVCVDSLVYSAKRASLKRVFSGTVTKKQVTLQADFAVSHGVVELFVFLIVLKAK